MTLLMAALLAAPGEAFALTFLELATGDEAVVPDARSVGMGRTRTAEPVGAFTGTTNPALLARLDGSVVSLGGSVLKLKEARAIPAYDSFDGYLVESIYVLNDEYQWDQGFGAALTFVSDGLPGPIGIAVSRAPIRDFQYEYSEEVRENDAFTRPRDALLAINEVQGDGSVDAWTFGAGFSPLRWLGVGLALQVLDGEQDFEQRIRWMKEGTVDPVRLPEASTVRLRSLTGKRSAVGLCLSPVHRLDIGATWKSETTLDGTFFRGGDFADLSHPGVPAVTDAAGGSVEVTYPSELAFGISYRPRAKVRTSLHFDATRIQWSDFEHELWEGLDLDDVWDFRVGIEHIFYNQLPTRFGMLYRPSPRDDEITTTAFTFGAGIEKGPLRADLAFEVSHREYRFEDLFDDALYGGRTRTGTDLVEEDATSAFVTLSYAHVPFGG
jgi:hypothetical protein